MHQLYRKIFKLADEVTYDNTLFHVNYEKISEIIQSKDFLNIITDSNVINNNVLYQRFLTLVECIGDKKYCEEKYTLSSNFYALLVKLNRYKVMYQNYELANIYFKISNCYRNNADLIYQRINGDKSDMFGFNSSVKRILAKYLKYNSISDEETSFLDSISKHEIFLNGYLVAANNALAVSIVNLRSDYLLNPFIELSFKQKLLSSMNQSYDCLFVNLQDLIQLDGIGFYGNDLKYDILVKDYFMFRASIDQIKMAFASVSQFHHVAFQLINGNDFPSYLPEPKEGTGETASQIIADDKPIIFAKPKPLVKIMMLEELNEQNSHPFDAGDKNLLEDLIKVKAEELAGEIEEDHDILMIDDKINAVTNNSL